MCTVREHARANYPSLEFEDYCAIMQLPVREGGLWGESLEAAAFVKMRGCRLNVYVRVPSSSIRPQYARIWHLEGTSDQETEERHLLWSGVHFDRLVDVAEGSPGGIDPGVAAKPKPITSFPNRHSLRKSRARVARASQVLKKHVSASKATPASAGLDGSPWRQAAIQSLGLSYNKYRKMEHSGDCAGWRQFRAGKPSACKACATLQLQVEKPLCGFTPVLADRTRSIGSGVGSNRIQLKHYSRSRFK